MSKQSIIQSFKKGDIPTQGDFAALIGTINNDNLPFSTALFPIYLGNRFARDNINYTYLHKTSIDNFSLPYNIYTSYGSLSSIYSLSSTKTESTGHLGFVSNDYSALTSIGLYPYLRSTETPLHSARDIINANGVTAADAILYYPVSSTNVNSVNLYLHDNTSYPITKRLQFSELNVSNVNYYVMPGPGNNYENYMTSFIKNKEVYFSLSGNSLYENVSGIKYSLMIEESVDSGNISDINTHNTMYIQLNSRINLNNMKLVASEITYVLLSANAPSFNMQGTISSNLTAVTALQVFRTFADASSKNFGANSTTYAKAISAFYARNPSGYGQDVYYPNSSLFHLIPQFELKEIPLYADIGEKVKIFKLDANKTDGKQIIDVFLVKDKPASYAVGTIESESQSQDTFVTATYAINQQAPDICPLSEMIVFNDLYNANYNSISATAIKTLVPRLFNSQPWPTPTPTITPTPTVTPTRTPTPTPTITPTITPTVSQPLVLGAETILINAGAPGNLSVMPSLSSNIRGQFNYSTTAPALCSLCKTIFINNLGTPVDFYTGSRQLIDKNDEIVTCYVNLSSTPALSTLAVEFTKIPGKYQTIYIMPLSAQYTWRIAIDGLPVLNGYYYADYTLAEKLKNILLQRAYNSVINDPLADLPNTSAIINMTVIGKEI